MLRRLREAQNRSSRIALVCGACLALLLLGGISNVIRERRKAARFTARVTAALVGRAAPTFRAVSGSDTLVIAPRPSVRLLIMFVADSCRPCRDLLTETQRMFASTAELADWPDVVVATLDAKQARDLVREDSGVRVVAVVDPDSAARVYRILSIPYLALVDENGRIMKVQIGYARHSTLEKFLSARPAS